jgi:cytochrome c553
MNARTACMLVAFAVLGIAGCNRNEAPAPQAAAPAASAPASSASAAAAAPAGPVIAPVAASEPTQAQRDAGSQLAAQGGGNGVTACVGCHGAQGEGNAAGGFPRLAGQSYAYLLHELESYAQGSRQNPVMQPIAKAMTPEQRAAGAAFYASLAPAPANPNQVAGSTPTNAAGNNAAPAAGANSARALRLANLGDEALGVQGCANCHGPGGIGSGELYPYLAGQHAAYLNATLNAWRDGTRANDPTGQMPLIAKSLTPQDVQALAAYYAAQPPRPGSIDAETMKLAASGGNVATQPAVQSGPKQAGQGQPATGGTEQGAATTGGAQGPGGGGGTSAPSTGNPAGTAKPQPGTR